MLSNNTIYCGDSDNSVVECVNLDSREVRILEIRRDLTQMICRNENLWTADSIGIHCYPLLPDSDSKVIL